ncbi:hypothetical protein MHU86_771 [Fragilaria crotonensis]|nr:hypothetical protein MHU86_771 [Fragilaria crotonensis]
MHVVDIHNQQQAFAIDHQHSTWETKQKSRLIARNRTSTGTFGCTGRKEPADDERGLSIILMNLTSPETQNRDEILDTLLEEMGEKEFSAMVESNRKADYPKWYARAKATMGKPNINLRKNKNRQLTLKAVPMRGIDTYFTKAMTTAHQAVDASGVPFLVGTMRVEEGTPSPTTKRVRRASSQIAEDIAKGRRSHGNSST